ncbi:MAG: DUF2199 domain-containing protein [Acidobacteria bacterium]|nr:DUF2199 domain-containing protein [Acidobacteriota bacterium]
MTYQCAYCGEIHDDLPDIGSDRPDLCWSIPETEWNQRVDLTAETCVIDKIHFLIRGVIELPIHDTPETFGFGVWISLTKEDFDTYLENPDTDEIGPFSGRLGTNIRFYAEDTTSIQTLVHFLGHNARPIILLDPMTNHPLGIDQRNGISLSKAWEIVHFYGLG